MNQLAQQIRVLRTAKNLSQDGLAEIFDVSLDYLVLGKEPKNNTKETGTYQTAEQKMDIWQFIAGYWWIVLSILGYLSWFLPHILPSIFG
ncbi:TPA: helix-turn-helix domain-containing protein [Streptococcus suis]|nr:helix-turn-helix domain-containing protein [Streptococcus suis]